MSDLLPFRAHRFAPARILRPYAERFFESAIPRSWRVLRETGNTMKPARYTISTAQGLLDGVWISILPIFAGATLGLYANLHPALVVLQSVASGVTAFGLYSWQFTAFGAKSLEFSDHGFSVEFRNGRVDQAAWAEITRARFEWAFGLHWKFWTTHSTLFLRGDGLSHEISRQIFEELTARGIRVSMDGAGSNVLFERDGADFLA
jgi:hypothetical protein